ncbi:nuclear transport factor 2 family protein [Myroides pelagicus]|uniref:nuclear transport factor 2 family protein n=1 Tax=Myroides pelagicus TaxID=270914 RepID=UPI002DBC1EF3|nr:nuclear transport factor 2 family protein [Myroides pelagicus]MEC4114781.1 nuclear transport factor 2 family protein [Myroides pelagicus]
MTKQDIINCENKLYQAMKDSDIAVLEELLHDDLLFLIPSGQTITKKMDIASYQSGMMKVNEISSQIENINIIEDIAVITLIIELKGSYDNHVFENNFRYIRFWKETSSAIQVIGGSGVVLA